MVSIALLSLQQGKTMGNSVAAVNPAQVTFDGVLAKTRFWQRWATTPLNERQVNFVNRLLDCFYGFYG